MTKEERFEKEYVPWCKKYDMTPSIRSKNQEEKTLGIWKSTNRKWEVLIEFNSQFEKRHKPKEERLKEYETWSILHGRLPSSHSEDKIEKSLGGWAGNNSDWSPLARFNSKFDRERTPSTTRIREYEIWCLIHDRFPMHDSVDKIEQSFYRFETRNKYRKRAILNFNRVMELYLNGNDDAKVIINILKKERV